MPSSVLLTRAGAMCYKAATTFYKKYTMARCGASMPAL